MKDFKFLEAAIIGLLVGVVVSTYILFVSSTGRFVGQVLHWISLTPVIQSFPVIYQDSLVVKFFFYVFVFIVYVVCINFLFRIGRKSRIGISLVLFFLLIGFGFEQKNVYNTPAFDNAQAQPHVESYQLASQKNKKYFGEEATGDLNNDSLQDVAFLIKRNNTENRGEVYYLASSLKTNEGYFGTNLIFVGEKIKIESIKINEGVIEVSYLSDLDEDIVEEDPIKPQLFYAQILEGVLTEIEKPEEIKTLSEDTQQPSEEILE